MSIRWKKTDKENLAKLVKNFNQKVTYWEKKGVAVPSKIKMKDLKEHIFERKDLEETIKLYSKFLKKGAEKEIKTRSGNIVTKYEYEREKRLWKKRENYKAKKYKELLNTEVVIDGRKMGYTYSHPLAPPALLKEFSPKPFILDKEQKRKVGNNEWDAFKRSVEKFLVNNPLNETDKRYKENYLKALRNNNIPTQIINAVKKISASELVNLLNQNYLQTNIDYPYDEENHDLIVERLRNFWVKGERNFYE